MLRRIVAPPSDSPLPDGLRGLRIADGEGAVPPTSGVAPAREAAERARPDAGSPAATPSEASTIDELFARLGASLTLQIEPVRRLRWAWYDTFDRRIARAGLTLREQRAGSVKTLDLLGADGTEIAQASGGVTRFAAELPDGDLAARVAAVAGLRAMLVVTEATCDRRVARVLNRQKATVARVTVDDVTLPEGKQLRVRVNEVAGHAKAAARIRRLLSKDAYLARAAEPLAAAVGAAPSSRLVIASRDEPASVVLRRLLLAQLDVVDTNIDGAAAAIDADFLRDMRTAVRRTRATLRFSAGALPAVLIADYQRAFDELADATRPVRAIDVDLQHLDARLAAASPRQAADLAPLRAVIVAEQRRARAAVGRSLRADPTRAMLREWRAVLSAPVGDYRGPSAMTPIGVVADDRIRKTLRRLMRRGAAVTDATPAEELFELRGRAKELRFALEVFRPLYDRALMKDVVRAVKDLQDNLREYEDCETWRRDLLRRAEKVRADGGSVATLLAIGGIAADLEARQARARAAFADAFGEFAHAKTRSRFTALTAGLDDPIS
jgi:CHAD domain-containing protein